MEQVARFIDLNADVGESAQRWASGEDADLLEVVTSANVSTGAYAGDDKLIAATCAAAARLGVRDDEPGCCGLLGFDDLDDETIPERLDADRHCQPPRSE